MSAGAFTITKYVAEYAADTIHPIKVQPETVALTIDGEANTATSGALTSPISAMVGANKRKLGLHAAMVSLRFTGTPPTGYQTGGILRVPLLNAPIRTKAVAGATGTYLGVAVEVVSNYSREIVR